MIIAECLGDPTAPIYQRFFAFRRELESWIAMAGCAVRWSRQPSPNILDPVGLQQCSPGILFAGGASDDEGDGGLEDLFENIFIALRDVLGDMLGKDVSRDIDGSWRRGFGGLFSLWSGRRSAPGDKGPVEVAVG